MSRDLKANRVTEYSAKRGLAIGLVAGVVMILVTLALRLTVSSSSITELAADWFTSILPGPTIDFLLESLSFSAKPLMFAGLLVVQVILGGLLGMAFVLIANRWSFYDVDLRLLGGAFGTLLWLMGMIILVPLFGGGFFASNTPGGTVNFIIFSLVPFLSYGLSIGFLLFEMGLPDEAETGGNQRRAFLKKAGIVAAIGLVALWGAEFFFGRLRDLFSPSQSLRTQGVLSTEVTPNDEFYVISKNIIDPSVNEDEWRLEIKGLVDNSFTLTYGELLSLPSILIEEFVTLECISNTVGGDLIGNAKWRGVPLNRILAMAGLQPGIEDISFGASDGYSESFPLEMTMQDEVMVAYEMNGEPLSDKHGFPARLIVPGFFGLKHVKWLTSIEPVNHNFKGFWQQRGWTDTPYVKTFSRFDIPQHRQEILNETVLLGGVAFAGNRGISDVQISDDGGITWQSVDTITEPLSPFTWVIWRREFNPGRRGHVVLRVRAIDGEGAAQTAEERVSLPDGASGHHEITLNFRNQPATEQPS